jgi:hypothetical protein
MEAMFTITPAPWRTITTTGGSDDTFKGDVKNIENSYETRGGRLVKTESSTRGTLVDKNGTTHYASRTPYDYAIIKGKLSLHQAVTHTWKDTPGNVKTIPKGLFDAKVASFRTESAKEWGVGELDVAVDLTFMGLDAIAKGEINLVITNKKNPDEKKVVKLDPKTGETKEVEKEKQGPSTTFKDGEGLVYVIKDGQLYIDMKDGTRLSTGISADEFTGDDGKDYALLRDSKSGQTMLMLRDEQGGATLPPPGTTMTRTKGNLKTTYGVGEDGILRIEHAGLVGSQWVALINSFEQGGIVYGFRGDNLGVLVQATEKSLAMVANGRYENVKDGTRLPTRSRVVRARFPLRMCLSLLIAETFGMWSMMFFRRRMGNSLASPMVGTSMKTGSCPSLPATRSSLFPWLLFSRKTGLRPICKRISPAQS